MASGLALPLPSSRRLEWAGWWGAEPDEWAMLSPKDTDQVEETEEAPGWQAHGPISGMAPRRR